MLYKLMIGLLLIHGAVNAAVVESSNQLSNEEEEMLNFLIKTLDSLLQSCKASKC